MKRFLVTKQKGEPSTSCTSTSSPSVEETTENLPQPAEPSSESSSESDSQSEVNHPSKKPKVYSQKYREEWQKMDDLKDWINRSSVSSNYFNCKVCAKDYIGGIAAAKKHSNSKKHKKQLNVMSQQTKISKKSFKFSTDKILKECEVRIAAFITEHNLSISVSDHLTDLINTILSSGIEGTCSKLSCGRTKCAAIINNVIGSTGFETLVNKLRCTKFSLLVDESTDNSYTKNLALVVRYNDNFIIKDEFLALIPVADTTALNLYNTIVKFFQENNIPYKENLVGFGADGAHSMMGKINSLQTFLKNDIPDLFVMKCVCHSLALCASYACKSLPDDVEKLVRSVYTYMQYSFKRKTEFKTFQTFLNIKPHKLLQPSQTRWLSVHAAVCRVLEQYEPLKMYFIKESADGLSGAAEIHRLLNNPINKLYLQFLEYILPTFTDLNTEFQAERPQIHLLYSKMAATFKLLLSYYIKEDYLISTDLTALQYRNPTHYVPIEDMYLGPNIAVAIANKVIPDSKIKELRINCLRFYTEAAHQIYKRFPFNSREVNVLKAINFLNPSHISNVQSIGTLAAHFPHLITDINALDREYRLLKNSDVDISLEMTDFWKKVCKSVKGDGSILYPQLSNVVTILLALPHSSASVERIFSTINLNKTKVRNRLATSTLSGILHAKNVIKGRNCYDFSVTNEMLTKHNNNMYKT